MRAIPPIRDHYSITTCEPLPQFAFVSYSLRIRTEEKVDWNCRLIILITGIASCHWGTKLFLFTHAYTTLCA